MTKAIFTAILAFLSLGAFASEATIQPLAADQFTLGGEVGVGGYYDRDRDGADFLSDGTTAFTLKTHYKNGNIIGYMENDILLDDKDSGKLDYKPHHDLDKLWLGYQFEAGTLSYGIENDTALDKVDGAGDMTVEFGLSAPEASDQFDVTKFQGGMNGLAYGVSHYNFEDDGEGVNGYVGVETILGNAYFGMERNHDNGDKGVRKLYSLSGNTRIGDVDLGANWWDGEKQNGDDFDGYYASAGYQYNVVHLSGGYGKQDKGDGKGAQDKLNFSASYDMTRSVTLMADWQRNMDTDNNQFYLKAKYGF